MLDLNAFLKLSYLFKLPLSEQIQQCLLSRLDEETCCDYSCIESVINYVIVSNNYLWATCYVCESLCMANYHENGLYRLINSSIITII